MSESTDVQNTATLATTTTTDGDNFTPYTLEITVSDPEKHLDQASGSTYVSYLISTRTNNPAYYNDKNKNKNSDNDDDERAETLIKIRRRYSDLLILYDVLANDHPTCVIPPVPDKQLLQYIAGDRFSQRFIQKRCHSIQTFLRRIAAHPVLSLSGALRLFLVSSEWETYRMSLLGNLPSNRDEVTDAFMNAFKSVRIQNDEFVEIKRRNDRLNRSITKLNKVFHAVVKRTDLLANDYIKLGTGLQELAELSEGEGDRELSTSLTSFLTGIGRTADSLSDLNRYIDYEYLVDLSDLGKYIGSMKQLVKLKDQKQIDYEELSEYLAKAIKERDHLISGYGGSNYLTTKLGTLAGINQESARREKISKLEERIASLGTELERAKEVSDGFEQETLKEISVFDELKTQELKKSLNDLADRHIKFYEEMLETWTKVEESLG